MTNDAGAPEWITIERTYAASIEEVWDLWTTKEGIEAWWAPDGFKVEVSKLELTPGGELLYAMTATGPEQVAFMERAGMPLTTEAEKTYTEVIAPRRLAYTSMVDFVPGVEPYAQATEISIEDVAGGVRAVMTAEPMHDEEWTQRLVMGRSNELDNLAKLIEQRRAAR